MKRHLGMTVDVNGNVVRRWMNSDGLPHNPGAFRIGSLNKKTAAAGDVARKMISAVVAETDESPDPHPEFVKSYEAVVQSTYIRASEFVSKKGEMGGEAAERFFLEELSHAMGRLNDTRYGGENAFTDDRRKSRDGKVAAVRTMVQNFVSSLEPSWRSRLEPQVRAMSRTEDERIGLATAPSTPESIKKVLILDSSSRVLAALGGNPSLTDSEAEAILDRSSSLAAYSISRNPALSPGMRRKGLRKFSDLSRLTGRY